MNEELINFGCYLVDHCEGAMLSEESIMEMMNDFLKSDYNKPDNKPDNWISMEDRKPGIRSSVIVYDAVLDIVTDADYYGSGFDSIDGYYSLDNVTHWMPEPSPPEVTE